MVSGTDFENVAGFLENGDATIQAIMWDKAGNVTMGSPSASTIHIDETTPTLFNVTIFSDNELGSRWAMVGNEVALNFTGSEGLSSPLCIMALDTLNATPGNNGIVWSAARTALEEDLEGCVGLGAVLRANTEKHKMPVPGWHIEDCRLPGKITFAEKPSRCQ